jgi:hypothetical protein
MCGTFGQQPDNRHSPARRTSARTERRRGVRTLRARRQEAASGRCSYRWVSVGGGPSASKNSRPSSGSLTSSPCLPCLAPKPLILRALIYNFLFIRVYIFDASELIVADKGEASIDIGEHVSLQMDSAPDSPPTASTTLIDFWSHDLIAWKVTRPINWALRRSGACCVLTGVNV